MPSGHKLLGRFRLLKKLGDGGLAEGWLAEEELRSGLSRIVALKRLRAEFTGDVWLDDSLDDQVEEVARIKHPNLIEHYESCRDDHHAVVVLEYVPGRSLFELMERAREVGRRIPIGFGPWVAGEIIRALRALGRPHRNISARRTMISFQGQLKLGGAVQFFSPEQGAGRIAGRFDYLSPEQVQGLGAIDQRTDIFLLGILLWELATGRRCFHEDQPFDTVMRISQHRFARPSEVNTRVPASLEAIILRAMERLPEERFQTIDDLHRALAPLPADDAPELISELFPGEAEQEAQWASPANVREHEAFATRIIAAPRSSQPYLVYADWLQQIGDPRGELIVLDHALRGAGFVFGFEHGTLRRDLRGAVLDEHQKILAAREKTLLKEHGKYLLEGFTDAEVVLRSAIWKNGFLAGVELAAPNNYALRQALDTLASAPSARFLQLIDFNDPRSDTDYRQFELSRFPCLWRAARLDPERHARSR